MLQPASCSLHTLDVISPLPASKILTTWNLLAPAPGVGYGAVLAHELAIQLSDSSADAPLALALFEGAHSLCSPAGLLSWLPEARRQEVCQVAAVLYPEVLAGAGSAAPSLEAFASRLASVAGYDEQLEYVASFRPAEVRDGQGEALVGATPVGWLSCRPRPGNLGQPSKRTGSALSMIVTTLPHLPTRCCRRSLPTGTGASMACCPA